MINLFSHKPLALAPMEDVTDIPFRVICKRLGADLVYTEFTSSEALIREAPKALKKIAIVEEERPVGIQIFGGLQQSMEQAARIAESFQPDFIDINCGCWVKDVALRGEGAGLLRDLGKFENIVKSTVKATCLPVTVKTRLGWDEKTIVIQEVAKMVEDSGAKALTIHCRTRSQGHQGQADWTWLGKIKQSVSIPIIGNGDVTTPEDVKKMFETGCDGVMIGRGAIMNPWIFRQAKKFLRNQIAPDSIPLSERITLVIEHLKMSVEHHGPKFGVLRFRKHLAGHLRGLPYVRELRAELLQMVEFDQIADRLSQFQNQDQTAPLASRPI